MILDVLVDTWGLREFSGLIKAAIKSLPEYSELATKLEQAIEEERTDKLIDATLDLFGYLVKTDTIMRIYAFLLKEVGAEEARIIRRKILSKFAVKFVPFIGPLSLALALVAAVYNNFERLTCK